MPISDKLFPGQNDDEKIISIIRRHWFTYVIFVLTGFIMVIPLIFLIIYWIFNPGIFSVLTGNIIILAISAYLLFIAAVLIIGIVDYYLDIYIVTSERVVIINQEGLFHRQISELHIHQVQDVSAQVEGFFQTIFHFGNVIIQTAAENENFIFNSIPHPYRIAQEISQLHDKYIDEHSNARDDIMTAPSVFDKTVPSGKIKNDESPLIKKSEIKHTVVSQQHQISPKQQNDTQGAKIEDTVMQEAQHYVIPPKKKKSKTKTVKTKEGEMKANKEINLE